VDASVNDGWTWSIWQGIGITGALIFYARFYVQWIYSELKGRSVMPVAFWYMSGVGSLMLLAYGIYLRSPIGTLSHCFNTIVYARNLVHISNKKGKLSRTRYIAIHLAVSCVVLTGVAAVVWTWYREAGAAKDATPEVVRNTILWLAVGVIGQALFASRFVVQWIATEKKKESTIPSAFWYISFVAALLMLASHLTRQEWVYCAGFASTLVVYIRNILLTRKSASAGE
jgi:4-amino-4-deoxy-L-arabinose transferase